MDETKPHPALKFLFPAVGILGIITVFWLSSLNTTTENDIPDNSTVNETEEISVVEDIATPLMKSIEEMSGMHRAIDDYAAQSCGMCHHQHYDDWSVSTHAAAITKTGFATALEYTFLERGRETAADCFACHAPYDPNAEALMADGTVAPDALANEGINCMTCHSNQIAAGHYLLDPDKPREYSDPTQPQWCASCHDTQQSLASIISPDFAEEHGMIDPGGNPYGEWLDSNYSKPGENYTTCLDCHGQNGTGTLHNWPEDKAAMIRSGYTIEEPRVAGSEAGFYGEITIVNSGTGHYLPSGDPGRALYIDAFLLNSDGEIIAENSAVLARYQSLDFHTDDTRIAPGGQFSLTVEYTGEEIYSIDELEIQYWIIYGYNPVEEELLRSIGIEPERIIIEEN